MSMPIRATGNAGLDVTLAMADPLLSAIVAVLTEASLRDGLAVLAKHTKPEGPFRDAVFLSLHRSGIPAWIEANSERGVGRTDLVHELGDGTRRAVEFKFWVSPDLAKPSKITQAARLDWEKHQGEVTLVTIISSHRSLKYFTRETQEPLWSLRFPDGMIAAELPCSRHVTIREAGFTVNVVTPDTP